MCGEQRKKSIKGTLSELRARVIGKLDIQTIDDIFIFFIF